MTGFADWLATLHRTRTHGTDATIVYALIGSFLRSAPKYPFFAFFALFWSSYPRFRSRVFRDLHIFVHAALFLAIGSQILKSQCRHRHRGAY